MIFLLTYWRYIAMGIAVLAFMAFLVHLKNSYIKEGYDTCVADAKTASMIQKEEARQKIIELEKKYDADIQKIISQGDSGYGVGPITSSVLDQLQERAGRDAKRRSR